MKTFRRKQGREWWLRDFTLIPDAGKLHKRALHGYWQTASYETKGFCGTMLLANPFACAPELRIPLPVKGRYSISIGMPENYSDRLLIISLPIYRKLAYHIASREGRRRLRKTIPHWPIRHALKRVDGIVVDRFHPGWNV